MALIFIIAFLVLIFWSLGRTIEILKKGNRPLTLVNFLGMGWIFYRMGGIPGWWSVAPPILQMILCIPGFAFLAVWNLSPYGIERESIELNSILMAVIALVPMFFTSFIHIYAHIRLAKSFNKGWGHGLLMAVFPLVGYPVLSYTKNPCLGPPRETPNKEMCLFKGHPAQDWKSAALLAIIATVASIGFTAAIENYKTSLYTEKLAKIESTIEITLTKEQKKEIFSILEEDNLTESEKGKAITELVKKFSIGKTAPTKENSSMVIPTSDNTIAPPSYLTNSMIKDAVLAWYPKTSLAPNSSVLCLKIYSDRITKELRSAALHQGITGTSTPCDLARLSVFYPIGTTDFSKTQPIKAILYVYEKSPNGDFLATDYPINISSGLNISGNSTEGSKVTVTLNQLVQRHQRAPALKTSIYITGAIKTGQQ